MKRIWNHPEEQETGKRYWRSVAELEQQESFLKNRGIEFPNGDTLTEDERENSRRDFMKLMGAAAGMMGLASCRRPIINLVPYTQHQEWMVPGKPLLYATSVKTSRGVTPLVATTYEGRPTHLQPNPLHPLAGGLDVMTQASILDLYDPERSQRVLSAGKEVSWEKVNAEVASIAENLKKSAGADTLVIVGDDLGVTEVRLVQELQKRARQLTLVNLEAVSKFELRKAQVQCFGAGVTPFIKFSKGKYILSLDSDFLGVNPEMGEPIKAFSKQRVIDADNKEMNRLYTVENRYTVTGGMADHRKPLAASAMPAVLAFLAGELGVSSKTAKAEELLGKDTVEWLKVAVEDLKAHQGEAMVLLGQQYSSEMQVTAIKINVALQAYGSCIELKASSAELDAYTSVEKSLKSGKIKQIISLLENDIGYQNADVAKIIEDQKISVVHLGAQVTGFAKKAALHIPAAHYLEAWGDCRSADGTYSVVQPLIAPLYQGVSKIELLLALLGQKKLGEVVEAKVGETLTDAGYEEVRKSFALLLGGMDEIKWNHTVRDGFLKGSAYTQAVVNVNLPDVKLTLPTVLPSEGNYEVVLAADSSVYDGRYINNAWLQEAPDPITKITWDNAAWIGAFTFRKLGLKLGQKIKLTAGNKSLVVAAIEAPGHVSNSITLPLGYGQEQLGLVGNARGFNAYTLRSNNEEYVVNDVKLEVLDEVYEFALTQEHDTMEGRSLIREGTVETFKKSPDFAQKTGMDGHIPQNQSLYKGQVGRRSETNPEGFDYENEHQWGMTIDLSKCLGCSACLVACQSENNIPVVGKDQVRKGRAMHWIRMDRYFATSRWGANNALADDYNIDPTAEQLENAEMVPQPVACQQCESAPCETVCPVNATVHTEEGLNAMAYNRCIGTRYCANNCPYTARRFNWFDYNKREALSETTVAGIKVNNLYAGPLGEKKANEALSLQKNPNVTVRMRGVIEKCTYCVQRLEAAKILQKQKQRDSKNFRIPTDSVKTACQAACSAEAIVFGDFGNKDSAVVKQKASPRNYRLLSYIGTEPRTSYLARLRNPNPKMPGASKVAAWSQHQI
jgi:molybdopterin-containing oxidoreductase family iron-sulfur binding subunit